MTAKGGLQAVPMAGSMLRIMAADRGGRDHVAQRIDPVRLAGEQAVGRPLKLPDQSVDDRGQRIAVASAGRMGEDQTLGQIEIPQARGRWGIAELGREKT